MGYKMRLCHTAFFLLLNSAQIRIAKQCNLADFHENRSANVLKTDSAKDF
jgi:hypothetical protein